MTTSQYSGVKDILARYWAVYGGWPDLLRSPYVHASLVLCAISVGYWSNKDWTSQALAVLPNLLGFTLGGFAVFLGFGDDKFRALIAGQDNQTENTSSPYLSMSASFLHFVLVQIAALLWAIIAGGMHSFYLPLPGVIAEVAGVMKWCGNGFGYWLFLYSILSAAAAAIAVFRTARWFDAFATGQRKRDREN